MMSVYLDESGIHDDAAICVIAGYFGRPGAWEKFKIRWRRVLKYAGIPLDKFHGLDLIEHRKAFFGMDRRKHQKLINDLAASIALFRIYPVALGLILDDFHELTLPQKRFFTGATIDDTCYPGILVTDGCPSKPYFMPFLHCVRQVLNHTPESMKAHFAFGLDRPFFRYAVEMFKMIKGRTDKPHSPRLGTIIMPEAKETPQLQAADLLSYLTYKHMLERHAANDWSAQPKEPLRTLLRNQKLHEDTRYFCKQNITESLEMTYQAVGNWDGH